jgi:hypothetical protein
MQLPVVNLREARFECTFGRGCEGICCRNGRPLVYEDEIGRIRANLPKLLPMMRPEAAAVVERDGFTSRRRKSGELMLRVVKGWCVFFQAGCVLHRAGAEEGDKFRYKPFVCAMFPLAREERVGWYVRQKGFRNEVWDLFCLDPTKSRAPAAETLAEEISLVERCVGEDDQAGDTVER